MPHNRAATVQKPGRRIRRIARLDMVHDVPITVSVLEGVLLVYGCEEILATPIDDDPVDYVEEVLRATTVDL
eukprot:828724-Amphidinium_carterae.1